MRKMNTNNNISAKLESSKVLSSDFAASTFYNQNEKSSSTQKFKEFSKHQNLPICFQTTNIAQQSNLINHMKLDNRMFATIVMKCMHNDLATLNTRHEL